MAEFYTEFPGKIRGHRRKKNRKQKTQSSSIGINNALNNNNNTSLYQETLKVEYDREKERTRFLLSKEWHSLNKRERKKVRALFRNQRNLSTQFLEQVTNITQSKSNKIRYYRSQVGHDYLEREMMKRELKREVREWTKIPLDVLSSIKLDKITLNDNRRNNHWKNHHRRKNHHHHRQKNRILPQRNSNNNSKQSYQIKKSISFPSLPSQHSHRSRHRTKIKNYVRGNGDDNNDHDTLDQDHHHYHDTKKNDGEVLGETLDAAFTLPVSDKKETKDRSSDGRRRRRGRGNMSREETLNEQGHQNTDEEREEENYRSHHRRRRKKKKKKKSKKLGVGTNNIPGSNLIAFQYNKTKEWNFYPSTKRPWDNKNVDRVMEQQHYPKKGSKLHSMEAFKEGFFEKNINGVHYSETIIVPPIQTQKQASIIQDNIFVNVDEKNRKPSVLSVSFADKIEENVKVEEKK